MSPTSSSTSKKDKRDNTEQLPPENVETMDSSKASAGPLLIAKVLIKIWSTIRQCEPPDGKIKIKTEHVRLITIAASHFCEKVRWILDMMESDDSNPYYYTEDAHPPGLHAYEPLKASRGQASITPMVVFHDCHNNVVERTDTFVTNSITKEDPSTSPLTVLWESSKIVETFQPILYPSAIAHRVRDMEADLGKRLGASIRCVAYYYIFNDLSKYHKGAMGLAADPRKMSTIESTLFGTFLPHGLAVGICKAMHIDREANQQSLKAIRAVFDEMSHILEASCGGYLMDEKGRPSYGFTAADLTLAALAYPFIRPPEMKYWLVDMEDLPPEVNELTKELRATRAGQHVLNMYQQHRPINEDGQAVMKHVNRNRSLWEWIFGH